MKRPPPEALDLSTWPGVDPSALDTEARKRYQRRATAIAGIGQLVEPGGVEMQQFPINSARVVCGSGAVRLVGAIVHSLAVMEQGEAFDDVRTRAILQGYAQSVEAHPRPMRSAMYPAPVESEFPSLARRALRWLIEVFSNVNF